MQLMILIGVIPALLVLVAGLHLLRAGPPMDAKRRFLVFLLGAGLLLLLTTFLAGRIPPGQASPLPAVLVYLLTPTLVAVLVLVLLNFRLLAALRPREKILAALLALAVLGVIVASRSDPSGLGYFALLLVLPIAVAWLSGRGSGWPAVALALASLVLLALVNIAPDRGLFSAAYEAGPPWLAYALPPILTILPGLAVALAAVLVTAGLRLLPTREQAGGAGALTTGLSPSILRFGLAGLLLAGLAYTIFWSSIWDQTSDGLGGVWYAMQASLAAIASSVVMAFAVTGRQRVVSSAFAAGVPILMFAVFGWGWGVSYHELTEGRAARVQAAIERFETRTGRYPAQLAELVPRDLLFVPGPVILRGEGWCYQGGEDYYRLGAFFREYFSTPLSLHIYASAGNPPDEGWTCGERLAEMKDRYDPPPMSEWIVQTPAESLPASAIPMPKTLLQPVMTTGTRIQAGDWSTDGRFWLFAPEPSRSEPLLSLHFLEAATGRICTADMGGFAQSAFSGHTAWLPDGRLLLVPGGQEMAVLAPCKPGVESLVGRFPILFDEVAAVTPDGSRILLKSADSYWILDGRTFEASQIAGVTPNPYELHWDRYAWWPDGSRLAISRLNGRDARAGSTLYVLDVPTGEILLVQPTAHASDQSAPIVDWVGHEELLADGPDGMLLLQLDVIPPTTVSVLPDLFGLDLKAPDQIWGMGWFLDPDGNGYHMAVRANHPRDQATYLYHSHLDEVEVVGHDAPVLMFFPGGEWVDFGRVEPDAPERRGNRLVVEGHLPRDYARLGSHYLPHTSQMVFCSSQGVSLVSLPDGELLRFWVLAGAPRNPHVFVAPGGEALVVVADESLYYIPLGD